LANDNYPDVGPTLIVGKTFHILFPVWINVNCQPLYQPLQ